MRVSRRGFLFGAAALPALTGLPSAAKAQAHFPNKPVKLILPYAPGGGPDLLTRAMAERMSEHLGQRVVVDNRVGAGGMLAGQVAANADPDGYTIVLGSSTHITQKLIQPSLQFDPLTSFVHITRLSISPSLLVVAEGSPYRSVKDLVAAAKAQPGKFNYASGGVGSAAHLSGAAFATHTGIDVVHVPYKGSVEIVPSIMSGTTEYGFPIASTAIPQINTGKVRALATTAAKRQEQLPDVPTLKEAFGSEDLVLEAWSGLWAPAKTPAEAVRILYMAASRAAQEAEIVALNSRMGADTAVTASPADFTAFMRSETEKYTRIVASAKIKAE
ncbi:Bug family tripartite tricarboxylate transporter substrate binding protein [Ferrovibrio sp.]|uniref:Bug family tripartite tricarboxylate transporter substrate binding protein n=1 Tax=Ferrovibrio sp. TaxID=1917215 RepID=UPI0035B11FDB